MHYSCASQREECEVKPRLYLAGPEVFLPNAVEHAEEQRALCRKYGFVPLHPMDNNLDLGNCDFETCLRAIRADIDSGMLRSTFFGVC